MNLHDTFKTLDLETLKQWILLRQQEGLHLEFKTISAGANLSKEDKKNLAVSISGFANSDGGLLIWGIRGRKDENNIDAADEFSPIQNVEAVLSRFNSLTGEASSPIIDGVQHRHLNLEGGTGIILTYVPASDKGPHMAKLGEGKYYKRSGDSFYPMEHFDIADMFGRRTKPSLQLILKPTIGALTRSSGIRSASFNAIATLVNSGRGLARFPLLEMKIPSPFKLDKHGLDGNDRTGLPRRVRRSRDREITIFAGGANDIIHAGTELEISIIEIDVYELQPEPDDLVIEYTVASEGAQPQTGKCQLSGKSMHELAVEAIKKSGL